MRLFLPHRVKVSSVVLAAISVVFLLGGAGNLRAQTLQSISVSPSSATIPVGLQQQFTATGNYSDGSQVDLTASATWATSKGAIATVNGTGLTTAKSAGAATISASYKGVTGSASLTVSSANLKSITVSPTNSTVDVNFSIQFTATGTYSDGKSYNVTSLVTWSSSSTKIAAFSKSGLATGVSAGVTTITASTTGATSAATSLTVISATLKSIAIIPLSASIPAGKTLQYNATGTFSDGSTSNITGSVTWSSSNSSVATINSAGLAAAVAAGAATITAKSSGISASTGLTVTQALSSISVSPSPVSLPLGLTQPFKATAKYSNGTTADITTLVSWNSSVPTVAAISNNSGAQGRATSAATGTTNITAAYLGLVSAPAQLTVTAPVLVSIAVSPQSPSIALGTTHQFSATGTYTNGSTQVITSSVAWWSSALAVATIGSNGVAQSAGVGTTTIMAVSGNISGTASLTVTPAALVSITVTPVNPTMPKGASQQLAATGTYTNGSTQDLTSLVLWTSSNISVATISSTGNAAALSTGTAQITATYPQATIFGQSTITVGPAALVSIAVTPANPSIALGTKQQFAAIGTYTDGSTQDLTTSASWSSSVVGIAMINSSGQATSEAIGTTTISATSGSMSGSTILTVTQAALHSIAVTPAIPSVPAGETQQFTATGTFTDGTIQDITNTVSWSSSDLTVATVSMTSPTSGLAQALAVGTTTIAASAAGTSGSTTLTVTPAVIISIAVTPSPLSFAKGTAQQLSATATYSDQTTRDVTSSTTWSSANNAIVTVSSLGLATAVQVGNSTITATSSGITESTSVQISPAVLVSISVAPSVAPIPLGTTQQFSATGNYSDGSTQDLTGSVQWTSSDSTVATISMAQATAGLATSTGTGSTTITASSGSTSGTAALTVTPAALATIAVTPSAPTIALGQSQQFRATGTYTDQSTKDITTNASWSTSNALVAIISNNTGSNGLATSSGVGSATITATMGSVSATTTLTVGAPQLISITITPANPAIPLGGVQQFTATGTYTDNSTRDLTNSVVWLSSNTVVAAINPSGYASTIGQGSTTISANSGTVSGSTTLTVSAPVVTAILISPSNPSITLGASQQFTATATYSDSTTRDVTGSAIWSSTNPSVATVSSAGVATTSAAQGTTTINATLGTVSGTTTLMVTAPVLVSITVAPANPSVSIGSTQQFTATGTYSNGTTQNLTSTATWSSSATNVATISLAGLATTVAQGQTTIQAVSGAITGSTTLTVTAGFVASGSLNIARNGHTATLLNNGTLLIVGGYNSDGTLASAELYNPVTGAFALTGALNTARSDHTATLLNNGFVLITGGLDSNGVALASAELYNPANGTFTLAGALNTARGGHTATALNSGLVLVAGGFGTNGYLSSAELYHPTTGTFTPTGSLNAARDAQTAALLNNGQVLIVGGFNGGWLASAELYTPAAGTFTLTGNLNNARWGQTETLLNNGIVLIAGGAGDGGTLASAELYDPATGTFTLTGGMNSTRYAASATLLNNGMVLMAGGVVVNGGNPTASAELYNPVTGTFTLTGTMSDARWGQTSNLLNNGRVLVTGGDSANSGGMLTSADLYYPASITPPNLVSIAVTPSSPTLPLDSSQQFFATGTFSDGSTQQLASVTWTTSNSTIATVTDDSSNLGNAYGVAQGTATLSACAGSVCGSTNLTVGAPALVSIAVSPANGTVAAGLSVQFHATGTYTDGSTQDLTSSLTWSSSAPVVATINSGGLATGSTVGSTTITATSGSISGTASLTVTSAVLASISVSPANPSISAGSTQQFTATGTYSDSSTQNLTSTATWASSATKVATISAAGLTTGVAQGSTTIAATSGSIQGSTTLTVTVPTLVSIAVTPANPSVSIGGTQQFTAAGTYSDGSMQNLTATVIWSSSAPNVASISSAGLANGVAQGQTTIQATLGTVGSSTTLAVTAGFVLTGSLNTARFQHTATLLNNGMVLIAGGYGPSGNILASAELYNPATGTFTPTGSLTTARYVHTATLLNNGMVLIAGGYDSTNLASSSAELYNPATGTFASTGSLNTARTYHTATLLNNGMVLLAGGHDATGVLLADAELYSTTTGTFTPTGSLTTAREVHTATLLNNGMVLLAGGIGVGGGALDNVELYDAATGTFTPTGSLNNARYQHTATLLNNGMVLLAGGYDITGSSASSTAELYNPATGIFTPTGSLNTARYGHTATLLNNGMALIAGGNNTSYLASAELYDPATGTFTPAGSLHNTRYLHTATLLNNGMVLIAGDYSNLTATAELFEPTSLTPPNLVSITVTPASSTITPGETQPFLATGTFNDNSTQQLASVTWSSSDNTIATITNDSSNQGHAYAVAQGTATLNACTGSVCGLTTLTVGAPALVSIAVSPANPTISVGGAQQFTATGTYTDNSTRDLTNSVTWLSSNTVVAAINASGYASSIGQGSTTISANSGTIGASTTLTVTAVAPVLVGLQISPTNPSVPLGNTQQFTVTAVYSDSSAQNVTTSVTWSSSNTGVASISAGGLASGLSQGSSTISAAYNGISASTALTVGPPAIVGTGSMNAARAYHTATLLSNGKVLIAGGFNGSNALSSAEIYDPATGLFTLTGNMTTARYSHTATLLPNGKVLIAGGYRLTYLKTAEVYDPATGVFTPTAGSMSLTRENHSATLLPNGKVLIAGGWNGSALSETELFDPNSGTFTGAGGMLNGRYLHTATLLSNGKLLIVGGLGTAPPSLGTSELYDPSTNSFTATGSLQQARDQHQAVLLQNGQVLVGGGNVCRSSSGGTTCDSLSSAEIFDPSSGTFATTGAMLTALGLGHTFVLLNNGDVFVSGGELWSTRTPYASTELFHPTAGTFVSSENMTVPRAQHTAILLQTGKVLLAGGTSGANESTYLASAELFDPAIADPTVAPTLVSVSPNPVTHGTGVLLTLTGTSLSGATAVTISGVGSTCAVTGSSSTTINATCTLTAGAKTVQATTPIGTTGTVPLTVN
jgi:hypothetical protein